jgi:drug/metabolite transporter (DMT)-like permease
MKYEETPTARRYGAGVLIVALAALSGLVWGAGDFAGGKATQRAAVLPVVWLSKLVSLPLLAIYLAAFYVPLPAASMVWGALAGTAGVVGLQLFYRALSVGAMTVVAPITAVTSAAIPVVVGLAAGERTDGLRLLGVVCALAAIGLVSAAPRPPGQELIVTRGLIAAALGAGASFALFFILTATAGDAAGGHAGLWPVAASQLSALVVSGVLLALTRPGRWPRSGAFRWTLVAGPFDMTANALYLLATRHGQLSLIAPLAALYPVTTVLLATIVDHERMRGIQVAGLAFAAVGLVLVST